MPSPIVVARVHESVIVHGPINCASCYDPTMNCCGLQEPSCGIGARSLAGLMELYESNYMRLRNLVPELNAMEGHAASRAPGALDLHLQVLERCRFTTTLGLTYYFPDEDGEFPAPDVRVRIYHDAQVAEVIACGRRRGLHHAEYNRLHHNYSRTEKWRMNRFLYKWLGYCLRQGHRFGANQASSRRAETSIAVEDLLLIAEP
jgi:uncharacterized protein YqiB (DUF1249 family)